MHGLAVGVLVLTDAGQCGVVEGGRGQVVLGTPGDILVGKSRGNSIGTLLTVGSWFYT